MKKNSSVLMIALILVSIALGIFNLFQDKKQKIASIDTAKVLKAYSGVKDLALKLEERKKLNQAQLDTLASEFQSLLKNFEKERGSLNEKEIKEKEQLLRSKQEEYAQFSASSQEVLKTEELQIIEKALKVINSKIEKYAKDNGYSAILGITPNGSVLYVSSAIDITDQIINEISE